MADFEFVDNLSKETIDVLHKHGVRTLIIHIDETHAHLQKVYKAPKVNLTGYFPEGWDCRKIKNERYSDIDLAYKIGFAR